MIFFTLNDAFLLHATACFYFLFADKGCVRHCIENMQRVQELSPLELVEMFVTVFCFLKDSSEVSQTLLDDFRSCQGYVYLSEFLLRCVVWLAQGVPKQEPPRISWGKL